MVSALRLCNTEGVYFSNAFMLQYKKRNNHNMIIIWQSRIHAYAFDYTSRIQQVYNEGARISAKSDHWACSKVCFGILSWLMAEALEEEAVLLPSSEGHYFGFIGLIIAMCHGSVVPPFLYAHRNFPQDTTIELGVKCVLVCSDYCHFLVPGQKHCRRRSRSPLPKDIALVSFVWSSQNFVAA